MTGTNGDRPPDAADAKAANAAAGDGVLASSKSLGDRVVAASGAVLIARVFLSLFGLIYSVALAKFLGSTALTAGLLFAYNGIIVQFLLSGDNLLPPAFVPVFMEEMGKKSEADAWRTASAIFTALAIALIAAAALLAVFPEKPVEFFAWLSGKELDGAIRDNAAFFLRWCVPTVLGLVLGSVTYAVLVSYKRFFWASFGEVSTKILVIASVVVGGLAAKYSDSAGPKVIAAVLVAAGFGRLATHVWALRDKVGRYRPALWTPAVGKYLLLAAPLAAGALIARARDLYNQYGAFVVFSPEIMTANELGRKISTALTGMVPFAVSIAMFPFLCEMVDRKDKTSLGNFLTKSSRMLLLVFAPMAAGAVALSMPASRLLYGWTGLTPEVLKLIAFANACYVLVIPAQALEPPVMQAYFSDRRTLAPTIIGIVMSTASMVWTYCAIRYLNLEGARLIAAVALGYTATRYLKVVLLVVFLRTSIPAFPLLPTATYLARLAVVTAATAAAVYGARAAYESAVNVDAAAGLKAVLLKVAPELAAAALAGFVVFVLGCKALRLDELGEMLRWAREKLRRRGKSSPGGARGAGGAGAAGVAGETD